MWRIQAMARHSSTAILRYLGQSHHGHLANIAVEAALNRDIQTVRDDLNRLRASAQADPLPALPCSTSALDPSLKLEDVEAPRTFPNVAPACPPCVSSHPYVMGTRRNGKVHDRDPSRPGWTLCSWHYSASDASAITSSPFGSSEEKCAPRCNKCASAQLLAEASSSESCSAPCDDADTAGW